MNQKPTFADKLTKWVGSYYFIIFTAVGFVIWAMFVDNLVIPNLVLSILAIILSSIILMSQNRMSDIDRRRSIADHEINVRLEKKIDKILRKL